MPLHRQDDPARTTGCGTARCELFDIFLSFLFWACVLSVPIAIISAFATKYRDGGEGLSFKSDLLLVIAFAHIAEKILGLLLTPFWFLRDIFRKTLTGADKIADYITYAIELIFFTVGMITL